MSDVDEQRAFFLGRKETTNVRKCKSWDFLSEQKSSSASEIYMKVRNPERHIYGNRDKLDNGWQNHQTSR